LNRERDLIFSRIRAAAHTNDAVGADTELTEAFDDRRRVEVTV
jgi:hypothetical protein